MFQILSSISGREMFSDEIVSLFSLHFIAWDDFRKKKIIFFYNRTLLETKWRCRWRDGDRFGTINRASRVRISDVFIKFISDQIPSYKSSSSAPGMD